MIAIASLLPRLAWSQPRSAEVAICDVEKNPESFNKREIRLRGVVDLEFEGFTLHSDECNTPPEIWLMFGGDVATPTMSTVNDTARTAGTDLTVAGVSYPLVKDENFQKFISLITARSSKRRVYPRPGYKTTATLTGTFFAGQRNVGGQGFGPGYGHLGCCYLFIIREISDIDSIPSVAPKLLGTVVSSSGEAVSGVLAVNETPSSFLRQRQETKSDDAGRFRFFHPGQLIWLRDQNFRPVSIMLKPGQDDVHVILEDAKKSDWLIPTCAPTRNHQTHIGRDIRLLLPGNVAISEKLDGDAVVDTITFKEGRPRAEELLHRMFPMVGSMRIMSDAKVRTIDDAEPTRDPYHYWDPGNERWLKDTRGTPIGVDARGQSEPGSDDEPSTLRHATVRWRSTIVFGRGAAEYFSTPEAMPLFDEIIDSVCVDPRGSR